MKGCTVIFMNWSIVREKVKKFPLVTIIILLLNIVVGIITLSKGLDDMLYRYGGMYEGAFGKGEWLRAVFYAFIHMNWAHFSANMFCLVGFGYMLERNIGWWRFLLIYAGGIAGAAVAINFWGGNGFHAGASGAIWALMFAAVVYNIRYRENIKGAFLCVLINLSYSFTDSNVSIQGHLGGAIIGTVLAVFLCKRIEDFSYNDDSYN